VSRRYQNRTDTRTDSRARSPPKGATTSGKPGIPHSRNERRVIFDLPSGQVSFEAHEVEVLRDAAAARAGSSTAARDLSLLRDRALVLPRPVAFRRAELQTLIEIATSADLTEVAGRLETAGSGTTG
jgi:hypothetical protein